MKDTSRIAWGTGLLLFGILFLLKQLNIFPDYLIDIIFDLRNLPFAFGVVLLFSQKNRPFGIALIILGALLYLKDIIVWTRNLSDIIWPVLLIGAGILLISSATTKRSNSSKESLNSQKKSSEKDKES